MRLGECVSAKDTEKESQELKQRERKKNKNTMAYY